MMRSLSNELSQRARHLLETRGRRGSKHLNWENLVHELVLPELTLDASVQNTLMIEETVSGKMIYMESPNGTIIRTSPDEDLERAIEILRKHMVLDDLGSV